MDAGSAPIAVPSAGSTSSPTQPQIVAERVRLLATRSRDAVAGVLIGALLAAATLLRYAPASVVVAWVSAFVAVNGFRVMYSRRLLAGVVAADDRALRTFFAFALANGLWLAALSLGFFGLLPLESRMALTVLVLLATAGGAATYASYVPGYVTFTALAIPANAIEWGRQGTESSSIVAITLVIYGATMALFSRYLASVFDRSVLIRFEREAVVEALQIEQQRAEEARRLAEAASQAKTRFLANASHDLRQPAQALALYTAVLQRTATTDSEREIAEAIAEASRSLGDLLNNLLDLSRLDAGAVVVQPARVQIAELVERLAVETRYLIDDAPIQLEVRCPPVFVVTDPLLLERVLRNLLHNAVKFTERGRIVIDVVADSERLRMAVEDTGCGISAADKTHVFGEFYQVSNAERDRAKGLGLGLSIVERLVRLLGGRVELASTLGAGSVFTVELPQAAVAPSAAEAAPLASFARLAGRQVLVIDDDPLVRRSLSSLLTSWQAEVDAVDGLAAALALQPQRRWAACLCDLRLRNGETGVLAAAALRRQMPELPVVLITGDTAPERIEMAAASGLPLLHKPVSAAALARELAHATTA